MGQKNNNQGDTQKPKEVPEFTAKEFAESMGFQPVDKLAVSMKYASAKKTKDQWISLLSKSFSFNQNR